MKQFQDGLAGVLLVFFIAFLVHTHAERQVTGSTGASPAGYDRVQAMAADAGW